MNYFCLEGIILLRDSWYTEQENNRIKLLGVVIYSIIELFILLVFMIIFFFCQGFGKTPFARHYLTLVPNDDLNIIVWLLIAVPVWFAGFSILTYSDWPKYFLETVSINEIDLFSGNRRVSVIDKKLKINHTFIKKYLPKKNRIHIFIPGLILYAIVEFILIVFSFVQTSFVIRYPNLSYPEPPSYIGAFLFLYFLWQFVIFKDLLPKKAHFMNRFKYNPTKVYFIVQFSILVIGTTILYLFLFKIETDLVILMVIAIALFFIFYMTYPLIITLFNLREEKQIEYSIQKYNSYIHDHKK